MDAKRLWYDPCGRYPIGIMTITGGLSVAHAKTMMEGFAHLRYWTRPADRPLNFHSARFDAAMPPEAAR